MRIKVRGQNSDTAMAVLFLNCLLLALLMAASVLYSERAFSLQKETAIFLTSISLLVVYGWVLWTWQVVKGDLFDPYTLFITAAVLFNGGQALLEIFRLNEFGILAGQFSPEIILETLFLIVLGIAAFHSGALLSFALSTTNSSSKENKEDTEVATVQALRAAGFILLAIAAIPTLLILRDAAGVAATSGYSGYLMQPEVRSFSALPERLAPFIVPGSLFLLAGSKQYRLGIVLSGAMVLAYSSTLLFLVGSRQGAAMLLIAYAWTFHRCIRPLPKAFLLGIGSLMVLFVFPLIAAFRNATGESLLSTLFSIDNPVVASLSEMGYTMTTVAYTVSLVPNYRAFDMGVSYLVSLLSVFPNLFWDVHPAFTHTPLDRWLVQTVEPQWSNRGSYALGYSFIAEAYLNFGWIGAPLALGTMGFLLGKLVLWADKPAYPARIAMLGAIVGFFLLFARGSSYEIVRHLLWYALMPYWGVGVLIWLIRAKYYKRSVEVYGFRRKP